MWMMGCRDSSGLNTSDSINGRKLRPLIPRPTSSFYSSSTPATTTTSSPSCLGRIHGTDFLSLHNHLGTMEHGKRELGPQPVSSRWNPTPEQLRTLEDLYRRGTRTPNAEQIQYITAQLRRYGKIEGKNVFYWFQNHKARERQKRKRRIEMAAAMQTNLENTDQDLRSKDFADTSRKAFESEGYKSWPSPTNCSTLAEESPLAARPECKREGRLECNAQAYVPADTQAAWQMMQLCSLPRFISSAPTAPVPTPAPNTSGAADPKLAFYGEDFDVGAEPSRTLELFPLRSDGIAAAAADKASSPSSYQFIQFLPLKN